eukprot:scaffold21131_cov134-Isochrysis_galbana.AAC.3
MRLHTPVNIIPEPTTLRRLKFCDVQRCLRVLSALWRQTPTIKRRHGLRPCRSPKTSAALTATRVPVRQTHQLSTQKVSQTVKHPSMDLVVHKVKVLPPLLAY